MIYDSLDQLRAYASYLPQLNTVISVLENHNLMAERTGFHATEDPAVRYNVIDYTTSDVGGPLEIHRVEADVQIVLTGKERAVSAGREHAHDAGPYDKDKDACFVDCPRTMSFHLVPGKFVIFFPGEPHRGNYILDGPTISRKVVFKLKL